MGRRRTVWFAGRGNVYIPKQPPQKKTWDGLCPGCGNWTETLPWKCDECLPLRHSVLASGPPLTPDVLEARIQHYMALAAQGLPLFDGELPDECQVPDEKKQRQSA
jgi:hypothetical protein